jgi:hypothetical protein
MLAVVAAIAIAVASIKKSYSILNEEEEKLK